jgi:hypothetical protein
VDYLATSSAVKWCPRCRAERDAQLAELAEERRAEKRAEYRRKTRDGRSGAFQFRLVVDGNRDLPCLPGLGLSIEEVQDGKAWADGTRFVRLRDKRVMEWQTLGRYHDPHGGYSWVDRRLVEVGA